MGMEPLGGATTLARVLIGLGRSEATGTLEVRGTRTVCRLEMDEGRVLGGGVRGDEWSGPADVLDDLRRWVEIDGLTLRFVHRGGSVFRLLDEPLQATELAMQLMRSAIRGLGVDAVRTGLGRELYRLTSSGDALVGGLFLRAEERAVVFWLRRGLRAEEVVGLPGCGVAGYRFLYALKLIGAASPRGGAYPLMLRKRRQVRAQASPRTLLDLPEEANGDDARRALRRLVRQLHPDRFGDDVSDRLVRASGEIVCALVAAEAHISAAEGPAPRDPHSTR